jgi:geranylgeranyl pyrophosphate synthase
VLGNPNASETMIARAREIIRSTGSLDDSEERIRTLHRRAIERIERSRSIPRSARPLLGEIAGKLIHRKI